MYILPLYYSNSNSWNYIRMCCIIQCCIENKPMSISVSVNYKINGAGVYNYYQRLAA